MGKQRWFVVEVRYDDVNCYVDEGRKRDLIKKYEDNMNMVFVIPLEKVKRALSETVAEDADEVTSR